MKKEIDLNFNGKLIIKNQEEDHQMFFHVDGDLVTIIPCSLEGIKAIHKKLKYDAQKRKEYSFWLYGIAEDGCNVAFYQPNNIAMHLSAPRYLGTAAFHSPIIIKSTSPREINLETFDVIEFRGGIIDYLHMTGKVVDECYTEQCIKFRPKECFEKTFPTNIDGLDFEIVYTISLSDCSSDVGKVPDLRSDIHSALQFRFSESQPINKFITYYNYALNFCQFCAGRLNVNFEVRLYKSSRNGMDTFLTKIRDGFDDYADKSIGMMQVIRFDFLGDKFTNVFRIINENETSPYLLFLPKRNKDIGRINYTDISDICVSLEKEYDLTYKDFLTTNREDAKALTKELISLIDKSKYEVYVKEKAKAIINGTLKNLKPSLKEKIKKLYDDYLMGVKTISEPKHHVELKIRKQYSVDEFQKMITKFIEIRNRVSHSGIVWNEGIEIFPHLQLLIYFNILKRAGYTLAESQMILSDMFGQKF